jgi:hypothetical protein
MSMLIECTKKLADTMKIKVGAVIPIKREPFYEWHANLFLFDRRKGIILMNNQTRYCIILYGLKAEHFKKLGNIVLSAIEETFMAEGFSAEKVKRYIEKCGDVVYCKTHDRSVLGQINDFHIIMSHKIEEHLLNENVNLVELNQWIGRLLAGSIGYKHPVELLHKAMEEMV